MATCTLIQTSGFPCTNESDPASFFDICSDHWMQIIDDHRRGAAERRLLTEIPCPTCRRPILSGPGVPVACSNPHCWEDAWWNQPTDDATTPARRGTDWVYYIRFGDRIKIGTSSNVKRRLSTLPYDEVLALEPGAVDVERARQAQFAAHRVEGQREWFHDRRELQEHIEHVRARHGAPGALLRGAA